MGALRNLSLLWTWMGIHLMELGYIEEAGEYYQKSLKAFEVIYQQIGTTEALIDVIRTSDLVGDNRHARGNYGEARAHHLKALELCERYAKIVPSAEEITTRLRNKIIHSDTEE